MLSWDIAFSTNSRVGDDDRDMNQDFLEYVIIEDEEEELHHIEERFAPLLKELIRMVKDVDIDLKEARRRVKTIAMSADKIKGGIENEIGMRSIVTTLTKTKLDLIKERATIIKISEELKFKLSNGSGGSANNTVSSGNTGAITGRYIARNQKLRNDRGTINNNIFDSPGGMYNISGERIDKDDSNNGAYVTDGGIDDDDGAPEIAYEAIGMVDYSSGATNTRNSRICSKDGELRKTEEVMYYDGAVNRFWVATVDDTGIEVAGRIKPLEYFINSKIDIRNMRAEDETGATYRVEYRDVSNMPEFYRKEWEILGGGK